MKTILEDRVEYTKDGKLHRLDGPACEWSDGDKVWYAEGKRHRIDGPAIELSDGSKFWYVKGKYHRLDGPAIELSNGSKLWFVEGKEYSETEFMHKFYPIKKPEYLKNS